jgi:hypothetical protein
MEPRIQILAIVAASGLLLVILELVRRRWLLERYALGWLFCAVALLVLAVWRNLLEDVAGLLGIADPPNALFLLAFGGILLLLLNFSVAVSRLTDQTKILAQRSALLDERLRTVEHERAEEGRPAVSPEQPERALQ